MTRSSSRLAWAFTARQTVLCAVAVALIALGGLDAWRDARRAIVSVRWVQQTFAVLIQLDHVSRAITDAWLSQRDFLLTREPRFLERYATALQRITPELVTLDSLTRHDGDFHERLAGLNSLLASKITDMAATLAKARQPGGDEAALDSLRADIAKRRMEDIRAVIDELRGDQQARLAQRLAVRDENLRATVVTSATLGALSLLIFAAVIASLNQTIRRRVAAEAAANESAQQLRVTLESIGDAVIATDLDGRVAFMNPIAQSLTGWRERDAIGVPLHQVFQILNEFSREVVENPVTKVFREGSVVGLANHTILVGRDGVERPIDDSGAPIRDAANQLIGVVLVFRDVTARRQAERSRERLLRAEGERATAESANRAKDEFLAIVSHELRAPVTAALSWVELLEGGTLKAADTTRALATVGRNLRFQSVLISDLLDVSRIVVGKLTIERLPVNMTALVQETVETFLAEADAKKIALRFEPPAPLIAMVDPGRIEQVLSNLLSNAIRFTPESGRVDVLLAAHDGALEVEVRDSGVGIPAAFLPYVFERFRQAGQPIVRDHGGLGLGLSIAQHLVQLHGGTIVAESDGEGQGASFRITLPMQEGPVEVAAKPVGGAAPPLSALVLLVEDHRDTREALAYRLRSRGARVVAAGSVAEALQLFRSQRPALLISDLALPGESGFSLIQQVRALDAERGTYTPAIAVSGFVSGEDRREALAAGFDDHVPKPIDFVSLLEKMRSLLAHSSG